jgi:hypothetical protein
MAVIAIVASAGAAPSQVPDPVTCDTRTGQHTLAVRLRDEVERFRIPPRFVEPGEPTVLEERRPAEATIERRIDEITVLDESAEGDSLIESDRGSPQSCGPPPTVTNIDSIRVRLGKQSEVADLFVNLQYGALAPGFTDEGDGSSEIELDARLGYGFVVVTMTRGSDSAAVRRPAGEVGPTSVNFNAGEGVLDHDMTVGGKTLLGLLAGGGNDTLTSSGIGRAQNPFSLSSVVLAGGQGADSLSGGNGAELFFNGSGADVVEAGGGDDMIIATGRAPDHIDCGPGDDRVLVARPGNRLSRCERIQQEPVFRPPSPRKILQDKRFPAILQRR